MKGLESLRASAWVAWVVAVSLAEIAVGLARTVRFAFRREMERERIRRILLEGVGGAGEPGERTWQGR